MYDLARVERIYGCVAEYNRCIEEETGYEPTETELEESERQYKEYCAKIEQLNGEPSEFIRNLVDKWESTKPDNDNIYAGYEWSRKRTLNIMEEIRLYYGVQVDEEYDTFYRVPDGKFSISVEYSDVCQIHYKMVGNLSYEQFKAIYRDLWFARLHPSMKYKNMIRSNCSLGSLLYRELSDLCKQSNMS